MGFVSIVLLSGLICGGLLSSPAFFIMKERQIGWIMGIGGFMLGGGLAMANW